MTVCLAYSAGTHSSTCLGCPREDAVGRSGDQAQPSLAAPTDRSAAATHNSSPAAVSSPAQQPERGCKRTAATAQVVHAPARSRQRMSAPQPGPWKQKVRREAMAGPEGWELLSPPRQPEPCQRHQGTPAEPLVQDELSPACDQAEIDSAVGACQHGESCPVYCQAERQ